jgi:hypothetical protein
MTRWTIYCHIHTESGRRYIGLTKKTVLRRWNQHVDSAHRRKGGWSHFANAIRKYGKEAFSHEVLEVCHDLEVANLAEECWIEFYDTRNPEKGFNLAPGGGHFPNPSKKNPWDDPDFRAKHLPRFVAAGQSPQARASSKASLNTPESKAKRSAATKAAMAQPETVAKREAMRADPSYAEKISASVKTALSTPEARARQSDAARAAWEDPSVREKTVAATRAAMERPEVRERLSEASRATWATSERRTKRAAQVTSPETRAKISAASVGRTHTPESIQRQRDLYLARSSHCKFCDAPLDDSKRTCIRGRVACSLCKGLHDSKKASFLRPGGAFV